MAASTSSSDSEIPMPGIDPELFVSDPEKQIIEELICAVCTFVARDAVTCPKGHQFCRTCISQWLKCNSTCPSDRSPLRLSQLNTARYLNMIVQKAQVKCTNGTGDSKCDWTGPYGNKEGHNKCCLLKEICCESCMENMQRKELNDHLAMCPKAKVQCDSCGTNMEREDLDKHLRFLCAEKMTLCPLQCKESMLRKDIMKHVLTACGKRVECCPIPGCRTMVQSQAEHNMENGESHTFLLLESLNQSRRSSVLQGRVHGYSWTVPDATVLLQSSTFKTGQLEWCLMVLPSDRHTRTHLGVFVKLNDGHPTLANVRVKLTYGRLTAMFDHQLHFKVGQIKGWPRALLADLMDRQPGADRLTVNLMIQNFLD